jgi:rod shape-determining protein MreC
MRSTVLQPVLRLQSGFADLRLTRDRLESLRAERDALSAELLALKNVGEENLRLRALVALAERGRARFVSGNLYLSGHAGEVIKRQFVLDQGEDQGVLPDAPVLSLTGLVGVVRAASSGQATGDFWTHPQFRVSAMTRDGRVFGIIRSFGDSPLRMRLDGAPYQLELEPGTELVTSGMGGVFPRGIPVGRVIEVTGEEEGWAKSYLVEPAVYPESVREVMVLVDRDLDGDLQDVWAGVAPRDTN